MLQKRSGKKGTSECLVRIFGVFTSERTSLLPFFFVSSVGETSVQRSRPSLSTCAQPVFFLVQNSLTSHVHDFPDRLEPWSSWLRQYFPLQDFSTFRSLLSSRLFDYQVPNTDIYRSSRLSGSYFMVEYLKRKIIDISVYTFLQTGNLSRFFYSLFLLCLW